MNELEKSDLDKSDFTVGLKIIELKDGHFYHVKIPFEFKDEFKENFPSAKWNPRLSNWSVESKAGEKLRNFVHLLNIKLEHIQYEKEKIEQQEILETSINSIDEKIAELNKILSSRTVSIKHLMNLNNILSDKKQELRKTENKLHEKKIEEESIVNNISDKLSMIIDFSKFTSAQEDMLEAVRINRSSERENWTRAQKVFEDAYEALKENGIISQTIYNIANVSWSSKEKNLKFIEVDLSISAISKNIKIVELEPEEVSSFKM